MSFVVTAATKLTRATPRRVRHFALDAGPSEPSPTHRDNLRFVRTDASTSALPPTPNTPNPSSSSSSAVPPNSIVLSPSAASDLPPPSPHPSPLPRVPFSTHTFVRRLESADVHRGLATEIMQATRSLMLLHEERAANELLSRADLENVRFCPCAGEGKELMRGVGGVFVYGGAVGAQDGVVGQVEERWDRVEELDVGAAEGYRRCVAEAQGGYAETAE